MSVTIDDLSNVENYLYFSSDVDKYLKTLELQAKRDFNHKRVEFSVYISRLRLEQVELVTKRLEEASVSLQAGIKNMEMQITSLQNVATILNTFSQLLSVVAGIVSFVALHPKVSAS